MSLMDLPKDVKTLLFLWLPEERDKMALRSACREMREASQHLPFAVDVTKGLEEQRERQERAERARREKARESCCRTVWFVATCCCCCGLIDCNDQEGD